MQNDTFRGRERRINEKKTLTVFSSGLIKIYIRNILLFLIQQELIELTYPGWHFVHVGSPMMVV